MSCLVWCAVCNKPSSGQSVCYASWYCQQGVHVIVIAFHAVICLLRDRHLGDMCLSLNLYIWLNPSGCGGWTWHKSWCLMLWFVSFCPDFTVSSVLIILPDVVSHHLPQNHLFDLWHSLILIPDYFEIGVGWLVICVFILCKYIDATKLECN